MKCCGSDRATPFCPICGKKLSSPSALVDLLADLRKRERMAHKKWDKYVADRVMPGNVPYGRTRQQAEALEDSIKLKKQSDRWKVWADAIEAVMNGEYGKIHSDWLEEHGQQKAAEMLRGAFS